MFEVGRLVARITLEGAQAFGRDLGKVRSEWKGLGSDGRQAASEVGRAGLAIGAAITAGVGVAIAKSAQFEKAMSSVAAVTDASASELGKLRVAALEAGESTVYTAEEAAKAIENLAKAGVGAADIYGGALAGSLALAAAGEVDVAFAAEVAATAMTQFSKTGRDVPHIADLLAAAAGKAQGDVTDMSFALKQSGLVASQFGISLEETTGGLAAFAANGLLGSDAGTSFRTMLLSLARPSEQAKAEMAKWNIEAYDAQGNFIGLAALAGQLEKGLAGATDQQRQQAMATIFGTDAIRAANVLFEEGAEGIASWTEKVDDSGYAAKVAAERQNNLAGDLEKLGGAVDTLFIKMGAGAQGPLRELVQGITGIVDAFSQLPAPLQGAITLGGAVVGGLALLGGAFMLAVPKVAEFRSSLATLKTEMPRTAAAAQALHGPMGIGLSAALTIGIAAMALWIQKQAEISATADAIQASLDQATGAMTDYSEEIVAAKLAEAGAYEAAALEGWKQKDVLDAVLEGGDKLRALEEALGARNNFVDFFNGSGIAAGNANSAIRDLREGIERAGQQYEDETAALGENTSATDTNRGSTEAATEAYGEASGAVEDLTGDVESLTGAVMEANGIGQDAVSQNVAYQETLAKTQEHIAEVQAGTEGYSTGLDENTEGGRRNIEMLVEQAKKSQGAAQATFELDGDTAGLSKRLADGRQKLIDNARAMGATADEANALADKIYGIPTTRGTNVWLDDQASYKIELIKGRLASIRDRSVRVDVNYKANPFGVAHGAVFPTMYAEGGIEAYASGGSRMREQHVAQIANAGAMRLWAEPETGGEAYIPLSPMKRTRSTKLLEQVADIFGYDLMPRGGAPGAGAASVGKAQAAQIERVTEIIQLMLNNREIARAVREYDRSVS